MVTYLEQESVVQGLLSSQSTLEETQVPLSAEQLCGLQGVESGQTTNSYSQIPVTLLQESVVHKLLSLQTIGLG